MDAVLQADLSSVHAPLGGDRVYKDECIYSYQTPVRMHDVMLSILLSPTWCDHHPSPPPFPLLLQQEREGGLYVSLSSFFGLGPDHLSLHHHKTGEPLYLHITRAKKVAADPLSGTLWSHFGPTVICTWHHCGLTDLLVVPLWSQHSLHVVLLWSGYGLLWSCFGLHVVLLWPHCGLVASPTLQPPPPKSHDEGEGEAPPAKKPTRLALGVEGGFDGGVEEEEEWEEKYELVVMPGMAAAPLPNDQLPQKVGALPCSLSLTHTHTHTHTLPPCLPSPLPPIPQVSEAIAGVLAAPTASKVDAIASWEGDKRKASQHAASLTQLDNGVKVPPSGWKCAKCDLTTNLWMNLTDGTILCGRRYWDGSGGNNHAVEHYEATRYPLAVKLGTITPSGADVHSYAEDDMVEDPLLSQHLQHFGINIANMTKVG